MLKFQADWRFDSPAAIPNAVVNAFSDLIGKISTQGGRQAILEHFKSYFGRAVGTTTVWSSSESWAETDLDGYMRRVAVNAPLFIEAFYDACEALRQTNPNLGLPSIGHINRVLRETKSGWHIQSPSLLVRDSEPTPTPIEAHTQSLDQQARELLQQSLSKSEELLAKGEITGRRSRRSYGF